MDVVSEVTSALERHPAVESIRLIGSRARGTATEFSDWDFAIETGDFDRLARDLPGLVAPFEPLAQQWERLSQPTNYMLMLRGPIKIDLLFLDRPNETKPSWKVSVETLQGIDAHFWDWVLWLGGKLAVGQQNRVEHGFQALYDHILRPLGVDRIPEGVESAIDAYSKAREEAEKRLGVAVARELEREVRMGLRQAGYDT